LKGEGTLDIIVAVKRRFPLTVTALLCALALLAVPFQAAADDPVPLSADSAAAVVISELQTGAATASDEFIELYNRSTEAVDITGWQIRYANSSVVDGSSTLLLSIAAPDNSTVLLPSHAYYVLHSQSITLAEGVLSQLYNPSSAGLSKTDKAVGLFKKDGTTCQLVIEDAVAWEANAGTTKGEAVSVPVPSTLVTKDKLLERVRGQDGLYTDSDNNAADFVLAASTNDATPGADNAATGGLAANTAGTPSALLAVDIAGCTIPDPVTPPDTDPPIDSPPSTTPPDNEDPGMGGGEPDPPSIPAVNIGLLPPQISELLPNPAAPQSDADDEFIELYNPNDTPFDLSGYVLEAGTTTKHRLLFTDGITLAPGSFTAFFSADTGLSLSNSGGQARLIDPLGAIVTQSEAYTDAKDGQAWILAESRWQWTSSPTPNAVNVVNPPAAKPTTTLAAVKKTTKKTAKPKVASATSSKKKTVKQSTPAAVQLAAATTEPPRDPLHPGVLALIAAFALLYGAYEYRLDLANKIHQFRSNRAARAALRRSAKGR
jgi:hypothetical protein